jgi:hypothetical protein
MGNVTHLRTPPETSAQSVRRQEKELRSKAWIVAREAHKDAQHTSLDLAEVSTLRALPPGVTDIYRRLSAHIDAELKAAEAILGRVE